MFGWVFISAKASSTKISAARPIISVSVSFSECSKRIYSSSIMTSFWMTCASATPAIINRQVWVSSANSDFPEISMACLMLRVPSKSMATLRSSVFNVSTVFNLLELICKTMLLSGTFFCMIAIFPQLFSRRDRVQQMLQLYSWRRCSGRIRNKSSFS